MIIITILLLIVAIAIPNISLQLSPIVLTRITSIAFIYAGVISYNTLYIQSIGSGISIFTDLFSVTLISQIFETFIYVIASLILVAWPIMKQQIKKEFQLKLINKLENYFDFILLVLVMVCLLENIIGTIYYLLDYISRFYEFNNFDFMCNMSSNSQNSTTTYTSNVEIVHNDGTWSNTIRSIFIYGAGAFRLHALRHGGTPAARGFVIGGALATDAATKILNNTINDPEYIKKHYETWKMVWSKKEPGQVELEVETETAQKIQEAVSNTTSTQNSSTSNLWGGDKGIEEISNKIISYILDSLKSILEPVTVNYSQQLLAEQIHDVSVILFIISILITFLILALLINIIVLLNADRILNFFKNKYIRWYITYNKKLISIEVIFLGLSILYFMYNLSMGIYFIATHPITVS